MAQIINVIGFDPGAANLGYCFIKVDLDAARKKGVASSFYVQDSGVYITESSTSVGDRMIKISEFIEHYIMGNFPEFIAVEAINRVGRGAVTTQRNENSFLLPWAFGEILKYQSLYGLEGNVPPINPTTLKAAITGSGRAKKPEIQAKIKELTGKEKVKPDEADAIGLALTAVMIMTGEYVVGKSKKKKKGDKTSGKD